MKRTLLLAALVAAGCGGSHAPRPVTLSVHAGSPLADSPVEVDVRGLSGPGTLRARWTAYDGTVWTSRTPLRGDPVRLRGVDGTRFLWGMRPEHPTGRSQGFAPPTSGKSTVALSVVAGGRTLARASLSRRITPASVHVRRLGVKPDGVYGELFTPDNVRPHAAVLLFGGSEGGDSMVSAAGLLAAHGYTTLSLAYFDAPGLPRHLMDIPLEYFAHAARILRRQPHVTRIVTLGVSRGGEASLLVASKFPCLVHGAIGLVPSSQVSGSTYRFDKAAWTLHGKPIPAGTPIAVERITGPILTMGAGQDTVWDSSLWVHQIAQRLRERHFRLPHVELTYPGAGHYAGIAVPYMPDPTDHDVAGGTPRADAAAKADLWSHILRYLSRAPG